MYGVIVNHFSPILNKSMTTQQLIIPNQFPRWMQIAYQSLDSEYTNIAFTPTANRLYLSGTTLEQGVSFTISGITITKPITTSKSAFVVCLDAITGAYIWHSWILGSGDQIPTSIFVNSEETALFVTGSSTTTDDTTFTVGNTLVTKPVTTGVAGFVLNLSITDGSCNWSSWIDGTGDEYIRDIQIGGDGSIYYVGDSTTVGTSIDIGGTTATKPATTAASGFFVKLNSAGALVFSQWFYGTENTFCRNLKIDTVSGDYIVCGDTITTGTSFTISGTTITKPTTSFMSAYVFRLLAVDATYVWDDWIYNSLNVYGNCVFLSDGTVYVGGRSNETGTSFFVSGVDIGKPATTNYSGYIIRLSLTGTYVSSVWIDGPDFDYITELSVTQSVLYVLGSSSSTGQFIRINNQDIQKPFTQNSAGFILALNSRSFEYLYGLWFNGSANEYNRSLVVQNERIFFTGISNSTETTLLEGDYLQSKPSTSGVFGYVSQYSLDNSILMRNAQLINPTANKVRMFRVQGRFGYSLSKTIIGPALYPFTTHTFTTTGITGRTGPTLSQCRSAYSSASWAQNSIYFNMTIQGIQLWTVPQTRTYQFEIAGASPTAGTNYSSGLGIIIRANIPLISGTILKIAVGQRERLLSSSTPRGGGGGSFVTLSDNTPIIIAGGGGGAGDSGPGRNAIFGTSSADTGANTLGGNFYVGGTLNNKQGFPTGPGGCPGAGLIGDGDNACRPGYPVSFINGAIGGIDSFGGSVQNSGYEGGFGGGGFSWYSSGEGGGGGGYSGGHRGGPGIVDWGGCSGGGSFIISTATGQTNVGFNTAGTAGYVKVSVI